MQFSSQLHVARYPYVALLSGSSERTKKVASSEGFATHSDLMQMLQPAVEEHGAQFVADQADHNERVSPLSAAEAGQMQVQYHIYMFSTMPVQSACCMHLPTAISNIGCFIELVVPPVD